jgi:hypothetical protein
MPTTDPVFLHQTFLARAHGKYHVIASTNDAFDFIANVKPRGLVWSLTWNCLCHAERDPASYGVETATLGFEEGLRSDGHYVWSTPACRPY